MDHLLNISLLFLSRLFLVSLFMFYEVQEKSFLIAYRSSGWQGLVRECCLTEES